MKRVLTIGAMLILIVVTLLNIDKISQKIVDFLDGNNKVIILASSEYKKDYNFLFVEESKDYVPYSYNDLLNIYFSFLNNGWDTFTFYCPNEYTNCLTDVKKISENNPLLTHINNYAHPYNSFDSLKTVFDESGEITLTVEKIYSNEDIKKINEKVDSILNELFKGEEDLDDVDKIMKVHDYIINNTRYDIERNETGTSQYRSNNAYGTLFEGYAICGGYADTMAIFLTKMGFKNFKIASTTHVWNAVFIDGKWLHLDLTWDDPVDDTGNDYLYHKYFLVSTETLKDEDGNYAEHNFDQSIYLEFKN